MFAIISESEWIVDTSDELRKARLLKPIPSEDIIAHTINDIKPYRIQSHIKDCKDKDGYSRYEAEIPILPDLYDLIFHGCSGYRAQYYHSIEYGETYNKRFVEKLLPIIVEYEIKNARLPLIVASLSQGDSKVTWYNSDDGLLYSGNQEILCPKCWVENWNRKNKGTSDPRMGLKDFLLENCRLFLKGTFVDAANNTHTPKPNRAIDLHQLGWT